MSELRHFHIDQPFILESGIELPGLTLGYTTLGTLKNEGSNVVWVCHALTGNAEVDVWWKELFVPGGVFDPEKYFVVCANAPGGCYGSTGPLSLNPLNGKKYYHDFPEVTNRDIVRSFDLLRRHLGINKIFCLIGGSLGGQQVLEWAIQSPDLFRTIIPVACNAWHSSWGVAFNESQRMAIEADKTWKLSDDHAGQDGLKAARAIAMLSYRSYAIYEKNQPVGSDETLTGFRAASYQRYMGEKISARFNAFSYYRLSQAMDSHHVGRGRVSAESALKMITAKTLVIGIDHDILFPAPEQKFLARHIPGATYAELKTPYGHDGFLVEFSQLSQIIRSFLNNLI